MDIHELEKIAAGWDDAWERQDNDACWAAYAAARRMQKHICNNFMRLLSDHKALIQHVLKDYPLHSALNQKARECYDKVTELEEVK